MKWLDLPPVWLAAFAALAYWQGNYWTLSLSLAHPVTMFLAGLLVGGGIGAQFGAVIGAKLKAEQLRILLALMVIAVCLKLALGLLIMPNELFSLGAAGGH